MARKKQRSTYLLNEPNWKELGLLTDPQDRLKAFRDCEYFVHYEVADKKKQETFKTWIKKESGWDKADIDTIMTIDNGYFSSMGKTAFVASKLGYWLPDHLEYINAKMKASLIDTGKKTLSKKIEKQEINAAKKVYTIQERMLEQVSPLCGEWEHKLDTFIDNGNFDIDNFDPYMDMRAYKNTSIKPAHAKIIQNMTATDLAEAKEIVAWKDEDIKEAFSWFTVKERKGYLAFYEKINTACETMIETGKATRKPRKPKAVSKEKLVSKLKYQINDSDLGIASINPVNILDASEVWVYNTKTRKLGVYKKSVLSLGLSVGGTSIKDYDPDGSVQKTLRKPADQLKMFKLGNKTKFMKSFSDIKATEIKLTGRLSDQIIILKSF